MGRGQYAIQLQNAEPGHARKRVQQGLQRRPHGTRPGQPEVAQPRVEQGTVRREEVEEVALLQTHDAQRSQVGGGICWARRAAAAREKRGVGRQVELLELRRAAVQRAEHDVHDAVAVPRAPGRVHAYLADPLCVRQREAQRVDGHVAPVQRRVFRVDVEREGVRVGEREGPPRPGDAYERDARPEGLALERCLPPSTADVADGDPMRRADGTVPGEASGGVKVAVERMNGWGVTADKEG